MTDGSLTTSSEQVSGQKLDPPPQIWPSHKHPCNICLSECQGESLSRTLHNRCFGDEDLEKSLLLTQRNACVQTASVTPLDGWSNTAAEAKDERGMSESPLFEIPVTHFGFGRNVECIQRRTKQLGFQGCELYFQLQLSLIKCD